MSGRRPRSGSFEVRSGSGSEVWSGSFEVTSESGSEVWSGSLSKVRSGFGYEVSKVVANIYNKNDKCYTFDFQPITKDGVGREVIRFLV